MIAAGTTECHRQVNRSFIFRSQDRATVLPDLAEMTNARVPNDFLLRCAALFYPRGFRLHGEVDTFLQTLRQVAA